jgi:hypothetical protein
MRQIKALALALTAAFGAWLRKAQPALLHFGELL